MKTQKSHRMEMVLIMVTILVLASHVTAATQRYSSANVPRSIPSYGTSGTISSYLTVPDHFNIRDINVQLDITHTFDADLDVYLSHNGVEVELFTDVGSIYDNFRNTILDDEALLSITSGSAPFYGSYRPEGNLSRFDNLDVYGTWQLRIVDDYTYDSGSLNSWSITAASVPEPTSIAILTLGGVLLRKWRRKS